MTDPETVEGEVVREDGVGPGEVLDALPNLAVLAAGAAVKTAEFAFVAGLRTGVRLAQVAMRPQTAPDLVTEVRHNIRELARELTGWQDLEERISSVMPDQVVERWPALPAAEPTPNGKREPETLSDRGDELLRRSSDVRWEEDSHPAYGRILTEVAPDEGRILRLMLLSGPQPSVDVRTGGPIGLVSSQLIAPGLNMIGARAGCRYVERVPQYLNNLFRLGLIWFSRETLRDPLPYQVVEAQPEVVEAMKSVRFARVVRRSIHLTPFGEDFCRDALNLRDLDLAALPPHADPESAV